jgi:hypothetical protein
MKGIIILALSFLVGCAPMVPLEQLETQALLTGDWTAVEKHERIIAVRNRHSRIQCPPGTIAYCVTYFMDERCSCVSSKAIRSSFER